MKAILQIENIILNLPVMKKEEAIAYAADLLKRNGYVKEGYYALMMEKEQECQTYIGNGVAIPHGISHSEHEIMHSGIVILQFPTPIDWNGNEAFLVIGIAGKQNEHIHILSNIACTLQDMNQVKSLVQCTKRESILQTFVFEDEEI